MRAVRTHGRGGPEQIFFEDAPLHGGRGIFFIVNGNRGQLEQISALVDGGKLKPVIAEMLPLAQAREAFEHGAANHAPGKSVLQVAA